jgi:hypothetical protein
MIGAERSRDRTTGVRTSAGSAKIAPRRLCVGISAAFAAISLAMSTKTDSMILRDMANAPD